jgi:AcrR family transcriptional regulator
VSEPRATAPAAERPLRADARRNRDRLLTVAAELFSEQGVEASLEEVAQRAGVGIGTLYRHFPSRDALIEAVYRRQVETLCDAAEELLQHLPADDALAAWMQRFVRHVATKRGLATALKAMVGKDYELFAYSHERVRGAADLLLGAAAKAGTIRQDVTPQDLIRAMSGICLATDTSPLDDQAARLVGLLMDGLRYRAAGAND